jgi:hypothetical protein
MSLLGADTTIPAPASLLLGSAQNPARPSYEVDPEPLERLYHGAPGLLVRAALIRPAGWSAQKPKGPEVTVELLEEMTNHLASADREHVVLVLADDDNRLIAIHEAAIGNRVSANVELLHVLKVVLLTGAERVYLVHNHPGGSPTGHDIDRTTTMTVLRALRCLGRTLEEHLIVARRGRYSFRGQRQISKYLKQLKDVGC